VPASLSLQNSNLPPNAPALRISGQRLQIPPLPFHRKAEDGWISLSLLGVCQLLIGRGEQLREIVEVKFRVQYSGKALGQPHINAWPDALRRCLADATARAVTAPTRTAKVHNMGGLNLARAVLLSCDRTRTTRTESR